jgi:hypothetical protein
VVHVAQFAASNQKSRHFVPAPAPTAVAGAKRPARRAAEPKAATRKTSVAKRAKPKKAAKRRAK